MKIIIFILTIFVSVSAFAQDDSPIKADGTTKYYIQVYDGEANEKVLYNNASHAAWQTKLQLADFFDGSDAQLWSFKATVMFPGYFSVINHDPTLPETAFLMSWNWNAYMGSNRDPADSKEMQYRFVELSEGWYKFEAIEKEDGFEGLPYTPGADALNIKPEGYASFSDVKSSDITSDNMVNKVFKIVEFNPIALFEESIERGQELYKNNPNAPDKTRYDLFFTLEKAREVRVFGTEGEMLEAQPSIDVAIVNFNQTIGLSAIINDARSFINTSAATDDVKNSFNAIVDEAEEFLNSDDLSYEEIDAVNAEIEVAQNVVEAILAAQMYGESLVDQDSMLSAGLLVSIDAAKAVLADVNSDASAFTSAISHLTTTQAIIDEILIANDLIATTPEFEEAKTELGAAVDQAIAVINTIGTSAADLDAALIEMQDAIKTFKRALEAGDTLVELKNAHFEAGLADWNVDSPTPGKAYPENKGVDGSKSITIYSGGAYQMKVFQSISNIPNGTYIVSCFAKVNKDNSIALFAESGVNSVMLPVVIEGGLAKRVIEIEVTNGMLQFGIRGAGEDNAIPGSNWIVFDEFEVKLSSKIAVSNWDFENNLTDWLVEGTAGAAYPENKGVDGTRSITCYRGADYNVSVSQTFTGLANGTYAVSAMAKTNLDSAFVVFGESSGTVIAEPVTGNQLAKAKTIVEVTDGTLKFGVKGAGEGNTVPAGKWIVFDNVEVVRMPDLPVINSDFENNLTDWMVEGTADAAYPENKGVDGSRSITCYRGKNYNVSVSQTSMGLMNGTYAVSAMAKTNLDGAFVVFGESAGSVMLMPVNGNQLAKTEALAKVTDGILKFGVKGAGEDNSVPAGKWIVFDDVALNLKSIIPVYEDFVPTPAQYLVTDVNVQDVENKITYWQSNQRLNIRSTNAIVKYSVYSITGAKVEQKETRNNNVSIPMRKGIYIVHVLTENGIVDTEKVSIR